MFGFLKNLLTNEQAFVRIIRGVALGAGGAITAGQVPMIPSEWGVGLLVIGGAITAGEKNPTTEDN